MFCLLKPIKFFKIRVCLLVFLAVFLSVLAPSSSLPPRRGVAATLGPVANVTPAVIRATYGVGGVDASRSLSNRQAVVEFQDQTYAPDDLAAFFKQYVAGAAPGDEKVFKLVGDPGAVCGGVGHGSLSEVSGPTRGTWRPRRPMSDVRRRWGRPRCRRWRADTSDVAVASAQVGRATAAEAAARSEVSGQQVGRGVRVGPCRTCDGGGGGSAVGRGGPARRAASAFARAAEKHVANRQGRT